MDIEQNTHSEKSYFGLYFVLDMGISGKFCYKHVKRYPKTPKGRLPNYRSERSSLARTHGLT